MPSWKARVQSEQIGNTLIVRTSGLLTDESVEEMQPEVDQIAVASRRVDRVLADIRASVFLVTVSGTLKAESEFGRAIIALLALPEQMEQLELYCDELADAGVVRLVYPETDLHLAARWARVPISALSTPAAFSERRSMRALVPPGV